jgi:hypothetical protein
MSKEHGEHPGPGQLERFARADPLLPAPEMPPGFRSHVLGCADCHARLARIDPCAPFGLLSALAAQDPLPSRPELPHRQHASAAVRWLAGAAAAAVAVLAVAGLMRAPRQTSLESAVMARAVGPYPGIVRRVESPTATVVTLLPPTAGGPTVTLIFDEDLDL